MEKAKTDRWYVCSFGPFAIVSIYFFLFFMSVQTMRFALFARPVNMKSMRWWSFSLLPLHEQPQIDQIPLRDNVIISEIQFPCGDVECPLQKLVSLSKEAQTNTTHKHRVSVWCTNRLCSCCSVCPALSVLFIRHSLAQIAMRLLGWLLALLKVKVYTAQQINEFKIYFDSVTLHLAWLHLPFCRCAALILYIEHGAVCRMQYNYLLMAFFHCSSSDGMFSVQFVRVPCVLIVLPPHIHILIVITRLCEWSCR